MSSKNVNLHRKPEGWCLAAMLLAPPLRVTASATSVAACALTALARNAKIGVRRLQVSRDW